MVAHSRAHGLIERRDPFAQSCIGGSFGCAAMMPATPISRVGSSRRKENFMQAFARPHPREHDLDVVTWLQAGETDHAFGKIDDLHRLPHVEHIDETSERTVPSACVAAVMTRSQASRMVMK